MPRYDPGPPPDRQLWIDGELVPWRDASVHVLSHSLQRGSLIFDYTSVHDTPRGTAIFRLDDHLERFLRSVSIVGLPIQYGFDELREASLTAARANPGANAFKICAYLPSVEVDVVPMDEHVSVAIAVYHGGRDIVLRKPTPRPLAPTLKVKIERVRRRVEAHLPTHAKASANYLGAMMAKWAARKEGFDEVVLLDERGLLAEAPTANVFLVDGDGALRTPTLDAVLAGVTRMSVLELARHEGIAVHEDSLPPEALYEAPEVFLASSSVGVWPVESVDGRPVRGGAPGPVSKRLQDRLLAIFEGRDADFAHWLAPVEA